MRPILKHTTNMLVFQHTSTARWRAEDGTLEVVLYGRTAQGASVALRVSGCSAYGFISGAAVDAAFRRHVATLVQWQMSLQRSEQSCRRYKDEHGEDKPSHKVYRAWSGFFFPQSETADVSWSRCSGFNIRRVVDGVPPVAWKFSTTRYDVWRALLSVFRDPGAFRMRIETFHKKMSSLYLACSDGGHPVSRMPSRPVFVALHDIELYETMFKPELVWMVDRELPACSWMCVDDFTSVSPKKTFCTGEYACASDAVRPVAEPPIPLAPLRVVSYDIEAVPYVNPSTGECEFPDPGRDIISTIGVTSFDMVSSVFVQDVFMLEVEGQPQCEQLPPLSDEARTDEYDPSATRVHSFLDELAMLRAFAAYIREYDPEIITGYNVLNFDNVYLLKRIRALCGCGVEDACDRCAAARTFSRVARPTRLKKRYTHTKQRGGQETWEASIEGRDWMDVYRVVMTDHKLRSYKLDNVCQELLGTKKIAIAYDDIPTYQQTPEGRVFLSQYCVKDAWLPCQIIVKRCKLVNAVQMSQVTGVQLTDILHRGQQIRTMVLMLRFLKGRCRRDPSHPRWFLPDESNKAAVVNEGFEGAVVITPKPGFYQTPVVTLDFASLYPSIMRAYNMCFSTLVPSWSLAQQRQLKWTPETHGIKDPAHPDYPEVRPVRSFDYPEGGRFEYKLQKTDVCFVTTKKRVGILPEILEALLSERKRVKKLRKKYGEKSMDYAVLDGRQLALKVCANSVYGFTGAGKGYLGEKRIASSVTRVGRGMANHTKFMCEDKYKEHGLEIVYGDTDSVFANIPASMCDTNCSREELIAKVDKIGDEMGKFCTQAFLPPNDLEYEKFYYPILLKGKKRYAGHKFEPGLAPKLDVKGFECVRRDFAPIVSATQKEVLIRLCKHNDVQGAINYAREAVVRLLENRVSVEELTMSKQLTRPPDQYKNPAPHTELAKRLQATQPAHIAPKTGDRIAFVIRPGFRGEKTCMRSVTPDDVRNGVAAADTRWYLSHQLEKPLRRIFEMVMDNADDIFRVTSVRAAAVTSVPMMRNFIQTTGRVRAAPKPEPVVYHKKKRRKTTASVDITSFFKQKI
jgi:DNA polymerase delta subunit 1